MTADVTSCGVPDKLRGMDHRLSVRAAAQERAARRRLIYMLLRNGDIGSLTGGQAQLRDHGPAIAPRDGGAPHALGPDGPVGERAA